MLKICILYLSTEIYILSYRVAVTVYMILKSDLLQFILYFNKGSLDFGN